MSTSELRIAANRLNALQSTGPISEVGKLATRFNATRHGLLSARLFLDDENPEDFGALLLELQSGLAPVGSMELALVERIAVTLWRQRRLVTAETSAITLTREVPKIASAVGKELGRGYGNEIKRDELQEFDPDQIEWCNTAIAEIEALEKIDLTSLPTLAPTVFEQLKTEAEEDEEPLDKYVQLQEGGLTGFVDRLLIWCQQQLREAERRPKILALAQQVRQRRLILPDDMLDVFSRYQTTLDNQLFKSLRALRDAQEWRLKSLEGSSTQLPTPQK